MSNKIVTPLFLSQSLNNDADSELNAFKEQNIAENKCLNAQEINNFSIYWQTDLTELLRLVTFNNIYERLPKVEYGNSLDCILGFKTFKYNDSLRIPSESINISLSNYRGDQYKIPSNTSLNIYYYVSEDLGGSYGFNDNRRYALGLKYLNVIENENYANEHIYRFKICEFIKEHVSVDDMDLFNNVSTTDGVLPEVETREGDDKYFGEILCIPVEWTKLDEPEFNISSFLNSGEYYIENKKDTTINFLDFDYHYYEVISRTIGKEDITLNDFKVEVSGDELKEYYGKNEKLSFNLPLKNISNSNIPNLTLSLEYNEPDIDSNEYYVKIKYKETAGIQSSFEIIDSKLPNINGTVENVYCDNFDIDDYLNMSFYFNNDELDKDYHIFHISRKEDQSDATEYDIIYKIISPYNWQGSVDVTFSANSIYEDEDIGMPNEIPLAFYNETEYDVDNKLIPLTNFIMIQMSDYDETIGYYYCLDHHNYVNNYVDYAYNKITIEDVPIVMLGKLLINTSLIYGDMVVIDEKGKTFKYSDPSYDHDYPEEDI